MAEFNIEEYEKMDPVVTLNGIHFSVRTQRCMWRVKTLMTKETDTMEWISTFDNDDILIDVGANVGMYTIWAAKTQGVSVYAFEPENQNYATLCRNIAYNGIHDRVAAYCLAVSDEKAPNGGLYYDRLNMASFAAGSSGHNFGDEVDFNLNPVTPVFKQGCVCVTLDGFVSDSEVGQNDKSIHIKIDVDGIEHKVINGATKVLQDPRVRSVLVELNTNLEVHNKIIGIMESYGYTTTIHPTAILEEGELKGIGNHIFLRK